MTIDCFKTFKKELTKLFVFIPEERPDWEEWMHEWYVEFKNSPFDNNELEIWAEHWFEPVNLKTHSFMLKTKAIKERDEKIKSGEMISESLKPIIGNNKPGGVR